MPTFAENLKRLRAEARMTQNALATASGVTQANISKYETGEAIPELSSLLKLATGLHVPLEPLIEGLDMRFDLMYQGLQVTVTDEEATREEAPTEQIPALDPSMDQIVRGFPPSHAEDDDEIPASPASPEEVAEARASLQRAAADILSAARFLAPRHYPVARDLGPGVRQRDARRRHRPRQSSAKKIAPKRR